MIYKKKMLTAVLLTLALMVSLNFAVFPISAQEGPKIFVYPPNNVFSTETTSVGDMFTVSINTSGWVVPGPFGYEFKLFFDPALLAVEAAKYPAGHFFADVGSYEIGPIIEADYVCFASIITEDLPEGVTGDGVFGEVTFEIIAAPPLTKSVSCNLTIKELDFLDYDGNSMFPEIVDGYYEFAAPRPPLPYLKVLPGTVSAEEVGDEVVVNITVQQLAADFRAVGFEWKLFFNTSILEYINATEGDFLPDIAEAAGPDYGTYFHAVKDPGFDYIISFSLYYEYPDWPPEIFPAGSGTLATITFNAIYKPTIIDMMASCTLDLEDVFIVDDEGNDIETEPHEDGYYFIAIAAPPWLSISPKTYTATALDDEFDLTVFVDELEADWKMVGAEFKIRYNLTMLDIANITEAGFMKHFAMLSGASEPYTWFQFYVDQDPTSGYGIVGVLILPLNNGTWPGPFPDTTDYGASGDLATVTFKSIYQHDELDLTSDIYLDEITLANTAGTPIPYDTTKTAAEGICEYTITSAVPPWPPAAVIENGVDLFTQYGELWGGMGLEQVSDAFPPQAVVNLNAYVTYHYDPVAYKPVSYLLIGPSGQTYSATVFTSEDGLAIYNFSLPGSESGLWEIRASVDLGGTVYSDTLWFLEGWLVEVVDITAPPDAKKGSTVPITVALTRICMQDPRSIMMGDLLLHMTVTDELLQPVGSAALDIAEITELSAFAGNYTFLKEFVMTIGANWDNRTDIILGSYSDNFVNTVDNGIPTSQFAFSGNGTIHANVLTDFPGVAYCPEKTKEIWLEK